MYYYLNGYQVGLEIASKTFFFLSKPIKLYCFAINDQLQIHSVEIKKFCSHWEKNRENNLQCIAIYLIKCAKCVDLTEF